MKQFNKASAIRKIKFQKNKNTYIKRLSISLSCLILLFLVILFTFARFENSSEEYTMINGQIKNVCEYEIGHEWTFDYTGNSQEFTIPCNGTYKLEVWGAQGGSYEAVGGYGGYAVGNASLSYNSFLYITSGGAGEYLNQIGGGGYNGGGNSGVTVSSGGGGATHISTTNRGVLSNYDSFRNELMIVAGGGGGTGCDTTVNCTSGGVAGGYIGGENNTIFGGCKSANAHCYGGGATQQTGGIAGEYYSTNSGEPGSFGQGGNGKNVQLGQGNGGGGGGGYYGGGGAAYNSGGGGSGYIGNSNLTNKKMVCYNCATSNDTNTKTISNTCHNANPTADCAKEGNGYARITLVSTSDYVKVSCDNLIGKTWTFDYTGDVQSFNAPCNGKYKVELWGAQGGEFNTTYYGGKGGYTSGLISINNNTMYLYVGGAGYCGLGEGPLVAGGYNGGGDANIDAGTWSGRNFCSGGGATDIRLTNGTWNNYNSLKSRIMVAAGGGGANKFGEGYYACGGHAGGLNGYASSGNLAAGSSGTPGATQTTGYKFGIGDSANTTTNGGGGGYYGALSYTWAGGAGGSSFISGYSGCNAIAESSTESNIVHTNQPNHYSGKIFTNSVMIDGKGCNWSTGSATNCGANQQQPNGTKAVGHSGNGYARITVISK